MKTQILKSAVAFAAVSCFASNALAVQDITYTNTTAEYSTATDIVTTPNNAKVASGAAVVVNIAGLASTSSFIKNDTFKLSIAGGAAFDPTSLAANLPTITGLGAFTAATTTAIAGASSFANSCVLSAANTVLTCTVQATTDNDATAANNNLVVTLPIGVKYDMTAATSDAIITASESGIVLGTATVKHTDTAAVTTAQKTIMSVNAAEQKGFAIVKGNDKTADVAFLFKGFGDPAVATNLDAASGAATASTKGSTYTPTGKFLLTLTGLPSAVSKVVMTGVAGSDATGVAKAAQNTGNFWLDGAGNGYAFLAAGAAVVLPGNSITLTMSGTVGITASDVKLAVNYLAGTNDPFKAHSVLAATPVVSLLRNGSSFSVNSSGPLNNIKITDNSGTIKTGTGSIKVTAYDAAGALAVGTAPVIAALTSNATRSIAMSTLTTAFPTAVRFDFDVESSSIVASNVKKTATGTTVTVYNNKTSVGAL